MSTTRVLVVSGKGKSDWRLAVNSPVFLLMQLIMQFRDEDPKHLNYTCIPPPCSAVYPHG